MENLSISPSQKCSQAIYVTGLVGSGKTILTTLLKEKIPNVDILFEPAEKWLDVQGHGSLWNLFLTDANRWALTAEIYVSLARIQALEQRIKNTQHPTIIVDRSIYEDRYVFAQLAYEQGSLSNLEWTIYQEWFAWITLHIPQPSGFIYVRASPEVTLARMKERGRIEEKDFPLALQQKFHQYYENLFWNKSTKPLEIAQIPVHVIDADKDFKNDAAIQNEYIDQISTFIKSRLT